jgi:hypothetical protein
MRFRARNHVLGKQIAALALIVATSAGVYTAIAHGDERQGRDAASLCGTVIAARDALELRGKPVFLTLGRADDGQDLTAVMLGENGARFRSLAGLIGRRICVTGRVRSFFGKPRMLVDVATE